MPDVIVSSRSNLQNTVSYGDGKTFMTDQPSAVGGDDTGPDPYTLFLAALGSCISMTVTMYARRKGWNLEGVEVRLRQHKIHAEDCADCETREGFVLRIERGVKFKGELTEEQRTRLHEIGLKCPLHKTLASEITFAEIAD